MLLYVMYIVSEDYSIILTVFILHDCALHSRVYYFIYARQPCRILMRVGSKDFVGAEEREDDKKQRALRGCGPNYPQWLLKTKKKNLTMSLGGRKDGATGFFSSFSFSICQQPFARERVESILSDSFTSCSANGTSRTAVRYSRIRVGETEMQNILLYCATLLNFEKYAL